MLQILREIAPDQTMQVFKQRFADPHHHGKTDQHPELMHRIGNAQARQKRFALVDYHIDCDADQDFRQHVERLVQHRIQHATAYRRAVGFGETAQAFQGMYGNHRRASSFCGYTGLC